MLRMDTPITAASQAAQCSPRQDIYTPLETASDEIWNRWADRKLREEVVRFIGSDLSCFIPNAPEAFLLRQFASPNHELFAFLDKAQSLALPPRILEYREDKYRSCNPDKYYLGKLRFCDGTGRNGGEKASAIKLIDFDAAEGKALQEIRTLTGKSLIDVHHGLLAAAGMDGAINLTDMTRFYIQSGARAKYYYPYLLALFVCNGILFENFVENENEKRFLDAVVVPAFYTVNETFGLKPLIVRLLPNDSADAGRYASYYPGYLKDHLMALLTS